MATCSRVIVFIFCVFSCGVVAQKPLGTCVPPATTINYQAILSSVVDCELLSKYDVSQMTAWLVSPQNTSVRELVTTTEEFSAKGCCGKPALFTHHGWTETKDISWNMKLQSEFANATGGCAVAFDYSGATKQNYICTATRNTDPIAAESARRIYKTLIEPGCLDPEDIVLMGLSMGSHIAVRSAYNMITKYNSTVGTIYCADPAGPVYDEQISPPASFYFKEVAKSVPQLQCIHSSIIAGTSNYNLCPSAIITGDCARNQIECGKIFPYGCNHEKGASYVVASYAYPGAIVAQKSSYCPWGLLGILRGYLKTTNTNTDILGYQSGFKPGQYYYYNPTTCIDIYNQG